MSKPVAKGGFRVDTRRPHSHSKRRAQWRHVWAVAAAMFPLMSLFVFLMTQLTMPAPERPRMYPLVLGFLACGMVALFLFTMAWAARNRRHEISRRNREKKYRIQAELLQKERERLGAKKAAEGTAGGPKA
jgi:hypothetical protein